MASKNTKMINEVFGRRPITSFDPDSSWPLAQELIGVEIEVEDLQGAARGSSNNLAPAWSTHADGSLRNGVEYVLSAPTGGRQLTEAINQFYDAGLRYSTGPRTSIHIHLNASDNMTIDQFRNMFVIMYLIEPAVFRWTDENRKWCGYCSPLTDLAPYRIINILNDDPRGSAAFVDAVRGEANSDRYYGFNVAAYGRHGTVEFRYFPCTTERQKVFDWIKFCMYIKKVARAFDSPEDILAVLQSESAITSFINKWFGSDIAPHIGRNLDYEDCLGRVRDMGTLVNVPPASLRNSGDYRRQVRSRGFNRFLQKNFPNVPSSQTPTPDAATASDLFNTYASEAIRRDQGVEALQRAVNTARERYLTADAAYLNMPNSSVRRLSRSQARTDLEAAQVALRAYNALRTNTF